MKRIHNGPEMLFVAMLALSVLMACAADRDAQVPPADTAAQRVVVMQKSVDGEAAAGEAPAGPAGDSTPAVVAVLDTTTATAAVPAAAALPPEPERMSVPVSFHVTATVLGEEIQLTSADLSDLAGVACVVPPGFGDPATGGRGKFNLKMTRFAHFGRADSPFAFQWVLYLPNDEGVLTVRPLSKHGKRAEVVLRGGLHFDVLLKGATKPLKLVTRVIPEFTGISDDGSPHGVALNLSNGPIGFYREEYVSDSSIRPMITVTGTTFTFGSHSTKYLTKLPQIVKAEPVDASGAVWKSGKVGGVRLEWTGTDDDVMPIEIDGYNVYRSSTPDRPGSWKLIASVPVSQRNLRDRGYDGRKRMAYRVTHRKQYPAEFNYEGISSPPAIVEPVGDVQY